MKWFVICVAAALVVAEVLLHILPWWVGLPLTLVLGLVAGNVAAHLSKRV